MLDEIGSDKSGCERSETMNICHAGCESLILVTDECLAGHDYPRWLQMNAALVVNIYAGHK